jgi:hypothetical protein
MNRRYPDSTRRPVSVPRTRGDEPKSAKNEGAKKKKPGLYDWSGSVDMVLASNDLSEDTIENALNGSQEVVFAFDPDDSICGRKRRLGPGFIKDFKEDSAYNEIATFTVDVEGNGLLKTTTVPLMVTVDPQSVKAAAKLQLTANVEDPEDVTWTVTGGALNGAVDADGVYTAPVAVPVPAVITVTAALVADATKTASVQLTITA